MTEPTTSDAPRRSRPMIVAAAAVAAITLAGGVALLVSDDDQLPVLDLGTAPPTGALASDGEQRSTESAATSDEASGAMAGTSMMAWVTYEAGDELPDLGGSAPVYRMVANDDDLRSIADHLGVEGEVKEADGNERRIADDDASVNGYGASFWYTSGEPYPGEGDVGVSSGCVAPDGAVEECEEPAPQPEPERPADLPSQAEAEDIIRDLAEAAGLDLTGSKVTSYDNVVTWGVNIDLALDGTVVPGWSVYGTVMSGGKVLDAGGAMGGLEQLGDYPLDTTRAAIDRLNQQLDGVADQPVGEPGTTDGPVLIDPVPAEPVEQTDTPAGTVSEPAPAPDEMTTMPVEGDGEPITVTLRRGELGYSVLGNADGTQTYLVPTYLLDGESDRGEPWEDVFVPAVRADLLGT